jgi:hypothetical protein
MLKSFIVFLVADPTRIWAVSAMFGVLFLAAFVAKTRYPQVPCVPLLIASIVWLAFGLHESNADLRKYNIPVDLVLFWLPFVFGGTALLTICFVGCLIYAVTATKQRSDGGSVGGDSPTPPISNP